jgi:hypothetical protein
LLGEECRDRMRRMCVEHSRQGVGKWWYRAMLAGQGVEAARCVEGVGRADGGTEGSKETRKYANEGPALPTTMAAQSE